MQSYSFYPEVLGNEEETRIDTWKSATDVRPAEFTHLEPKDWAELQRGIDKFCPTLPGSDEFRENGSRTYLDGRGVELATPEVDHPDDLLLYTKANARLLEMSLADYISKRDNLSGVFQRRVIDGKSNTWACQDNFSIQGPPYEQLVANEYTPTGRLWDGHLRSRGFITGAMLVGKHSAFSQRMSVAHSFSKYGFGNSLLRVDREHGQRLEIRCSDINLKDWAFLSRVGGSALLLAATRTTLGEQLSKSELFDFDEPDKVLWNIMPLDKNYDLFPSKGLTRAIEMQRFLFSSILENLETYTNEPMPAIYRKIGNGMLKFCDDIESVIAGKKDLDLLTDRADWAEKLNMVRGHIRRNPRSRRMGDTKSKIADLMYDRITISTRPESTKAIASYGYGHVLAEQPAQTKALELAIKSPPQDTRARIRVLAAKRFSDRIKKCNWHALVIDGGEEGDKDIPLKKLTIATAGR